jgi:hypothetical protein
VQIAYRWVGGAWGQSDAFQPATTSHTTMQPPDVGSARYARSQAGFTKVASEMSSRAMFWGYRHALVWGVGPIYAVLIVIGLGRFDWLRRWREQLPLPLVAGAVLVCIWMYLWYYHDTTRRYAVTVVIPLLPLAAVGLSRLADWMTRCLRLLRTSLVATALGATAGSSSSGISPQRPTNAYGVILACIVGVSMIDAVNDDYRSREVRAELGTWVAEQFGRGRTILCSEDIERLVGYYAGATHDKIPKQVQGPGIGRWVDRIRPELVILWLESPGKSAYEDFLASAGEHGYAQIDSSTVPQDLGTVRVFVREPNRLVSRPR